jgi:hypothetical protein
LRFEHAWGADRDTALGFDSGAALPTAASAEPALAANLAMLA